MKSPKQQFLMSKDIARRHVDRMDDPEVQHCIMIALAQFTFTLREGPSGVNDAKRIGAQEFIEVLSKLGFPQHAQRGLPDGQLIPPDFRPTADKPFPT